MAGTNETQGPTIRAALETAWDAASGASNPTPAASSAPATPAAEPAGALELAETPRAYNKDEKGRFAKKATGEPQAAAVTGTESDPAAGGDGTTGAEPKAEAAPVVPAKTATPAPASWKPEAKKAWSGLPAEVQAEVVRREREVSAALARAAPGAKLGAEVEKIVAPYRQMMEAEGSTWQAGLASHLQMSAVVRQGTPQQKANLVAGIMAQFAVEPGDVATAFEGLVRHGGQRQPQPLSTDPKVEHLAAQVEELAAYHNAIMDREAAEGYEEVAALPHFEELRETMAEILTTPLAQTRNMSFKEAYRAALALHPELEEEVLAARLAEREAKTRAEQAAEVERAKKASVSIAPRPGASMAPPRQKMDRSAAVQAAVDKHW